MSIFDDPEYESRQEQFREDRREAAGDRLERREEERWWKEHDERKREQEGQ